MRWKQKQPPTYGARRIVNRFLLFPKCLDCEWRWLELTQIHQEYGPVRWMMDEVSEVVTLRGWVDMHWSGMTSQ